MTFTSGTRSPRLDAIGEAHDLVAQGIDHAIAKHGDSATDLLPLCDQSDSDVLAVLGALSTAGWLAKRIIERGDPDQSMVLAEEVGEFADAVLSGGDWRSEVIRVAAVATMMAAEEEADDELR